MTREQMIDTLDSYCDKAECSLCEFQHDYCLGFHSATDEELKRYVERISEKVIDTESQNVCELGERKWSR